MSTAPRTADEQIMLERFSRRYALADCELMHEIRHCACGCDYSGTSWTTGDEARTMHAMLGLGTGKRLLEVGTGAGWPGLYLAELAGCDAALLDLPLSGLRAIMRHTRNDGAVSWAIAGDGAALPFADAAFDAIVHSDVLCCLRQKQAVLESCRRVIRPRGTLVFSVIFIAADLDGDQYAQAAATGPPFIETPRPYTELLERSGWLLREHQDLTTRYRESLAAIVELESKNRRELENLLGEQDIAEQFQRRQTTMTALEQGLIRRELFRAEPA